MTDPDTGHALVWARHEGCLCLDAARRAIQDMDLGGLEFDAVKSGTGEDSMLYHTGRRCPQGSQRQNALGRTRALDGGSSLRGTTPEKR